MKRISTKSSLGTTAVLCLLVLALRLLSSWPDSSEAFTRPHIAREVCLLTNINPSSPNLWEFSTRSLCVPPALCLSPSRRTLYTPAVKPECAILHANLTSSRHTLPAVLNGTSHTCETFRHDFVYCAHGSGLRRARPECPLLRPLTPATKGNTTLHLAEPTIVVPDYAFPRNMYHFVNPVTDLVRVVERLSLLFPHATRPNKLHVLQWQSKDIILGHPWKHDLLEILLRERLVRLGLTVTVHFLPQAKADTICLDQPIVLGRRGHYNTWAFPNGTDVALDGSALSKDSVDFRRAVYGGLKMKTTVPGVDGPAWSDLPPFVVGYAKRKGKPSGDGYFKAGGMRRFSEDDERWFGAVLHNETRRVGAQLKVLEQGESQSFEQQVREIEGVGIVVGIHGANLVNTMFVRPFGALLEIFPKDVTERCYLAGGNAGLRYLRFEAGLKAGVVESGCYYKDVWCEADPRQRMIKLAEGDRERLAVMVRQSIEHVMRLRERFPMRVPVRYDGSGVRFVVDGTIRNMTARDK